MYGRGKCGSVCPRRCSNVLETACDVETESVHVCLTNMRTLMRGRKNVRVYLSVSVSVCPSVLDCHIGYCCPACETSFALLSREQITTKRPKETPVSLQSVRVQATVPWSEMCRIKTGGNLVTNTSWLHSVHWLNTPAPAKTTSSPTRRKTIPRNGSCSLLP